MSTFTDALKNSVTGRLLYTLAIDISNYWTILGIIACAYFYGRHVGEQGITGHAFPIIYFGWLISVLCAKVVLETAVDRERDQAYKDKVDLIHAKAELREAHDKANWRVTELENKLKQIKL